MPRSAFACCRRSSLTVSGVSPVEAGLKKAVAVPALALYAAVALWLNRMAADQPYTSRFAVDET